MSPGEHTLLVNKTVGGDLMSFAVPFTVGDDGAAEVIAEVAWGRVHVTSLYEVGGVAQREVRAPDGSRLRLADGRLVELTGYAVGLVDEDGDGVFERTGCEASPTLCGESGVCADGQFCACTPSCPFCDELRCLRLRGSRLAALSLRAKAARGQPGDTEASVPPPHPIRPTVRSTFACRAVGRFRSNRSKSTARRN